MHRDLSQALGRALARELVYSSGISGTAFNTLDAATSSAAGTVHPIGAGAATLDALTSAGWGTHTDAALEFDYQHGVMDPRMTVTRSGSAWTFDSTGTLVSVAANTLRIWHDPTTLQRLGFLQEESRTQSIKNSSATGGVAGTPGTVPTGWSAYSSGSGISRDLAYGTENGMPYAQIRIYGTASGVISGVLLSFVGAGDIPASNGQTWTGSLYIKQTAGASKQVNLTASERDAGGVLLGSTGPTFTATSSYARQTATRINTNGSTALETLEVRFNATNGEVIDATYRIAVPQMELGAWATSPMLTTSAAITRNTDQVAVTSLGAWFNSAEGTMFVDFTPLGIGTLQTTVYFDDTTANERMGIRSSAGANAMLMVDGNVTQAQSTLGTIVAGTAYKSAMGWKLNDVAGCQNNGTVQTDTGCTIPTVTRMYVGSRQTSGTDPHSAIFRKVKIYATRKSNAEIQAMTA